MTTMNRQMNTAGDEKEKMIVLEATRGITYGGKEYAKGEVLSVSKSEAKRILTLSRGVFRIKLD